MSTYKELEVWQLSMPLAEKIYAITQEFPKNEIYGLTSQMRRASVSIAANIAEGAGRNSLNEYAHFLSIAYGSCCELETLCTLAQRLGFLNEENTAQLSALTASISRMLKALRKSIKPMAA